MINTKKLSVVGLGKLGCCLAASLSYKGFDVLGYDINKESVDLVNQQKAPVLEPRLQELMTSSGKRLRATTDHAELIEKTDITFIIVPTPSTKKGDFSSAAIQNFIEKAMPAFRKKKGWHLFVVTSTVSPTTTEKVIIPMIEKLSGKKLNKDFGVCYNPEFIALGDVIHGTLNPDMVLIGESDKKSGDVLEKIQKKMCENSPYVARMSLVSAEIAKISLNSFITMKISFANTLGNICEAIPEADVDAITQALGADKRISPHYLKAGLSFGGPCFPRDNRAFSVFAKEFGIDAHLAKATDRVHEFQIGALMNRMHGLVSPQKKKTVSVIGLSYKPKTEVIEESAAVELIKQLLSTYSNISVSVYDPLAMKNVQKIFKDDIHYAANVTECLDQSNVWVLATPDKNTAKTFARHPKRDRVHIVDCWRILGQNR